jgi:hypothetical protein
VRVSFSLARLVDGGMGLSMWRWSLYKDVAIELPLVLANITTLSIY